MADDRTEAGRTADSPSSPAGDRPRRSPPTIDLNSSEVSDQTQSDAAADDNEATRPTRGFDPRSANARRRRLRWIVPAVSGAVAALVVVGLAWAVDRIMRDTVAVPPTQTDMQAVSARIGELSGRVSGIESKLTQQPAPPTDAETRNRVGELESGLAGLRDDIAALRKQIGEVAAATNDLKAAPREGAASPDLSALTERLSHLEQSIAALPGQVQSVSKSAERNETSLQRLAVAAVLEARVRSGAPFADALKAAKKLSDDAAALTPLDRYAATGVPPDATLSKDLLASLQSEPKATSPDAAKQTESTTSGSSGVLDRLLASSSRLVRVERADTPAAAPASSAALEAAARRNDVAAARDELAKQPDEIKTRLKRWSSELDARDAAMKAAASFAASALAAASGSVP